MKLQNSTCITQPRSGFTSHDNTSKEPGTLHGFLKRKARQAFSLIEILVVLAIIGIVLGIAVPALNSSRQDSIETAASANAKSLNDARTRAKLKGDTNPVLDGNDAVAAAQYLIEEGYLTVKQN